jgi:hypothetical protein
MCWGLSATAVMVTGGLVATAVTVRQRRPAAIPATIAYFTLMEALQIVGYLTVDQCGLPVNQSIAFLSIIHIIFQPFFINAFAMELLPVALWLRVRSVVYGVCGLSAAIMLLQLYPFDWAGVCRPGSTLCGPALCTVSGDWHIGWEVPFNGLASIIERSIGIQAAFPSYVIAAFLLPVLYGAWRFALFHLLVGPILANLLSDNPNEWPAIWCLMSIGIVVLSLSPWLYRRFERKPATSH